MLRRCTNPKHVQWSDYGGRGIAVCKRWMKFENFIADMGRRPSRKHSIDRIDNSRGYSQSNCRWATRSEQNRNTRRNRMLTVDGVTKTLVDWLPSAVVSERTVARRLAAGMSHSEALFACGKTPGNRKKKNK